jgi:hypothetical protein
MLPVLLGGFASLANAAEKPIAFEQVAPIFQKHCYGCHGTEKPKGDLRLDKLDPDLVNGKDGDHWREVMDRLNFGDMPPETEPALAAGDRDLLTQWLVQERRRAALAKNPEAHFRRLTRREYELTMQDLLGLPLPFGSRLPEEGKSPDGFLNNGDMLRMSPRQYETYLQIADEALAEAIVSGEPPVVHRYRFQGGERANDLTVEALPRPEDRPGESFEYFKREGREKAYRIWRMQQGINKQFKVELPPSEVQRHSEAAIKLPVHCFALGFHRAFRSGEAVIRVRAARLKPADEGEAGAERLPSLTVALGATNFHGVELTTVGQPIVIDHTEFRTHEFRVRMETMPVPNVGPPADRNAAVLAIWNSARPTAAKANPPRVKIESSEDRFSLQVRSGEPNLPRLKIEWVEFENPFLESWPPPTHRAILFANDGGLDEPAYARAVVERFATRAYRRPVTGGELDRLMKYWGQSRQATDSLEQSLRETLSVVLSSPQFLSLAAASGAPGAKQLLDDYELAARLSYFLWSSMPDETLLELAAKSKLREPEVLAAQVRRLIEHNKGWQFIEQFSEQWLELDRLERVTVNRRHYPAFNDELAAAMRLETLHFFAEVLRENGSIFQLVDADFTFVNEALAAHYGIEGVTGAQFRRVPLSEAHHRGGVLTQASVLTGTSDGSDGHPIKRGMWLLKNLLDERPPPPPPTVPELNREDPKVRDLTIPQALAVHRNSTACASCHRKIDPWGVAFEEYDAIGNWQRDGAGADLRRRRTQHPIESEAELPGGVKVAGMKELKAELLQNRQDDFRRALVRKVLAYALGRALTLEDLAAADALAPQLAQRGDRLGTLVELIAASEAFQSK